MSNTIDLSTYVLAIEDCPLCSGRVWRMVLEGDYGVHAFVLVDPVGCRPDAYRPPAEDPVAPPWPRFTPRGATSMVTSARSGPLWAHRCLAGTSVRG